MTSAGIFFPCGSNALLRWIYVCWVHTKNSFRGLGRPPCTAEQSIKPCPGHKGWSFARFMGKHETFHQQRWPTAGFAARFAQRPSHLPCFGREHPAPVLHSLRRSNTGVHHVVYGAAYFVGFSRACCPVSRQSCQPRVGYITLVLAFLGTDRHVSPERWGRLLLLCIPAPLADLRNPDIFDIRGG